VISFQELCEHVWQGNSDSDCKAIPEICERLNNDLFTFQSNWVCVSPQLAKFPLVCSKSSNSGQYWASSSPAAKLGPNVHDLFFL